MSLASMNVKRGITETQFTGKGKITQQYLIHGNLPDIMKTFKRDTKTIVVQDMFEEYQ